MRHQATQEEKRPNMPYYDGDDVEGGDEEESEGGEVLSFYLDTGCDIIVNKEGMM